MAVELPNYVWIEAYQQYVPVYNYLEQMNMDANVPSRVAVPSDNMAGVLDTEGEEAILASGESAPPAGYPSGHPGVYKDTFSDYYYQGSTPYSRVPGAFGLTFISSVIKYGRVIGRAALPLIKSAGFVKFVTRAAVLVAGYTVAMHIIDAQYAQSVEKIDSDGDGVPDLLRVCTGSSCAMYNPDTGDYKDEPSDPNLFQQAINGAFIIGIVGVGIIVVGKYLVPALTDSYKATRTTKR